MSSPVHVRVHGLPHSVVMTWLGAFWAATPGVVVSDNTTLRLDRENVLQPDACLWIESSGRAWIDRADYLAGAPELVVEIAASSAAHDLHDAARLPATGKIPGYGLRTGSTLVQLADGRRSAITPDVEASCAIAFSRPAGSRPLLAGRCTVCWRSCSKAWLGGRASRSNVC